MADLTLKKVQLELMKVSAARMELELRIEEFKENIIKLETSVAIQLAKEEELNKKISDLTQGTKE